MRARMTWPIHRRLTLLCRGRGMTDSQLKTAHSIAFGVLLVGLLMICYAMGHGDLSPTVGIIGWTIAVLAVLGSYSYFEYKGRL